MALETHHFVQDLSRTPLLFVPRYVTTRFPKHITHIYGHVYFVSVITILFRPPTTERFDNMAHGPWAMAMGHGPWPMGHGPRALAHGPWPMAHGPWPVCHGPWAMDHGPLPMAMKTFRGEPCEQFRQTKQNRRGQYYIYICISISRFSARIGDRKKLKLLDSTR